MKILALFSLLVPILGFSQNADWKELQNKIDSAVKINGVVLVNRNYKIDKPLVAAKWNGKDYDYFTIQIIGQATMWDVNSRSVIVATFNDAPALSIHKGKGVLIKGINLQGEFKPPTLTTEQLYSTTLDEYSQGNSRDSRYSPYCAIAIDPFMHKLPPDNGYPMLKSWYRGSNSVNGSIGIRIEDCTMNGFIVGAITSPNGHTLNAESITFQNIRIGNCKIGFAGCQSNEKMVRVINVGAWGTTHTLFGFNLYGNQEAGNWIVDGVNVAGNVVQLITRKSNGSFPMYLSNVFAESIGSIGEWSTNLSDRMDNASVNFRYIDQTNGFPDYALKGYGVTISNSTLRYYGQKLPILFIGEQTHESVNYDHNSPIFIETSKNQKLKNTVSVKIKVEKRKTLLSLKTEVGNTIGFFKEDRSWAGYGIVESITSGKAVVAQLSPSVIDGNKYLILLFDK